ncbi:unnamed protein product [Brassica rapa subsp. narinosa]
MEMKILEALNFYLVVFHPYRSLPEFLQDSGLNDTIKLKWPLDAYNVLWKTIGSCQRHLQDGPHPLSLIHPPYLITLACIYIASVYKEKDIRTWFEELYVGMNIASFQNCTFDHKGLFKSFIWMF